VSMKKNKKYLQLLSWYCLRRQYHRRVNKLYHLICSFFNGMGYCANAIAKGKGIEKNNFTSPPSIHPSVNPSKT
jgi:hypothetical protein